MKNYLWLIPFVVFFACSGADQDTVEITGVIKNLSSGEAEVLYYKDYMLNTEELVSVPVDANGHFRAVLPVSRGELIYVRTDRRNVELYALPGARLDIMFDAEDRNVKTEVSGHLAFESAFLSDYQYQVERLHSIGLMVNRIPTMSISEFTAYIDSVHVLKQDYLANYADFEQLDKEFADVMQTNIRYEKYRMLLEFPLYYEYFNQVEASDLLPDGYYDFLDEAAGFNQDWFVENMRSRNYLNFLTSYQSYVMQQAPAEMREDKTHFELQYHTSKALFPGQSRDFALAQTLISALNFEEFNIASTLYEDFLQVVGRGEYRELVVNEFRVVQALAPGNKAPDFTARDKDGNLISLSDYRGQVVYLDFWASWCGPCMREMPYVKELKQKLSNQLDLVFMYISIDTDEQAWRNTVDLHGIEGVHLNFPGTTQGAPSLYNVKGVPTFFIIGRDGRIFDNRPPRPSNPDIYGTLMAALLQ